MRVYNLIFRILSVFSSIHHFLSSLIHQLYFYLCHQVSWLYYLKSFPQTELHFLWLHLLVLFLGVGKVPCLRSKIRLQLWHLFLLMFRKLYGFSVLLRTQQLDQIILLFSPPFQICFLLNKF